MSERQLARADLLRAAPFRMAESTGDGLTLDGMAATFNSPTVIDSWEGRFREELLPGSFKRTLSERTPRMQFDHGMHPLIGSIPIGKVTSAVEQGGGVHVVARLSDNWLVQPVRDAIAEGSIDGMSFRFEIVREEWVDSAGKAVKPEEVLARLWTSEGVPEADLLVRRVRELKCSELGPVVWPAYETTSVAVRSKVTIDLANLADPRQRRDLARAVLLADLAEAGPESAPVIAGENDAPQPSADTPGEHPTPVAPPPSDVRPGEHPSPDRSQDRTLEVALFRARLDLALKGAPRYGG